MEDFKDPFHSLLSVVKYILIAHTSGKPVATMIIFMSNATIHTLLKETKMEAAVQQNSLVQVAVCSQKFPQEKIK